MEKRFNTTGPCNEKKHYMVNLDKKLTTIEKMINRGEYFVINRPRQYGKTTVISQLSKRLKDKYIVVRTSFEGIGDKIFTNEELFSSQILGIFAQTLVVTEPYMGEELEALGQGLKNLNEVSIAISKFIKKSSKPVILFIDEVDKSSNNQLFLSFLGMLRNKFIMASDDLDFTFHSVVLAGVHDVKNLKIKIRQDDEAKYNSPWNIAVNFNVDMSFDVEEIETMLLEYEKNNGLGMETKEIAERIYYYSDGYPFLVSRICQIIDEDIIEYKKEKWTISNVDRAVKLLLAEKNPLIDSLVKNLENNKELIEYVYDIAIDAEQRGFNQHNPIIEQGVLYGFMKNSHGKVKIANRFFEQVIYNYLTSKVENKTKIISNYNYRNNFINENGGLDFEKVLLKFQQFMKENYSSKDEKFIEREGRLLFMAFVKPIINGVGFDFKEAQISEEKRLDLIVTYNEFKYVIELKIWRGEKYHQEGLNQLSSYLEKQSVDRGYLLVFDFNKGKEYKSDSCIVQGKNIIVVWV